MHVDRWIAGGDDEVRRGVSRGRYAASLYVQVFMLVSALPQYHAFHMSDRKCTIIRTDKLCGFMRTVKFYKRLYLKSGLLHDVFWSFMISNCDDCMRTVFIPLQKAIRNLQCQFYNDVFGIA